MTKSVRARLLVARADGGFAAMPAGLRARRLRRPRSRRRNPLLRCLPPKRS